MTRGKTETEHREQKNVVTELHEFHPDGSGAIVHAALYGLVNARVPYGTRHSTNTPIKPYEYLQATAGSTDHKPPTEPFRPGCDFHQVGAAGQHGVLATEGAVGRVGSKYFPPCDIHDLDDGGGGRGPAQ